MSKIRAVNLGNRRNFVLKEPANWTHPRQGFHTELALGLGVLEGGGSFCTLETTRTTETRGGCPFRACLPATLPNKTFTFALLGPEEVYLGPFRPGDCE